MGYTLAAMNFRRFLLWKIVFEKAPVSLEMQGTKRER